VNARIEIVPGIFLGRDSALRCLDAAAQRLYPQTFNVQRSTLQIRNRFFVER
jgi:hypothetical protein